MKSINEVFEDDEFAGLESLKKLLGMSWHDFIIHVSDFYKMTKEVDNGKSNIEEGD